MPTQDVYGNFNADTGRLESLRQNLPETEPLPLLTAAQHAALLALTGSIDLGTITFFGAL